MAGKVSQSSWHGYSNFAKNHFDWTPPQLKADLNVYAGCRVGSTYDYKTETTVALTGDLGTFYFHVITPPQRVFCGET